MCKHYLSFCQSGLSFRGRLTGGDGFSNGIAIVVAVESQLPGRILRPFPQHRQIPFIDEHPAALPPRDLAHDAETIEEPERGGHGWRGEAGS